MFGSWSVQNIIFIIFKFALCSNFGQCIQVLYAFLLTINSIELKFFLRFQLLLAYIGLKQSYFFQLGGWLVFLALSSDKNIVLLIWDWFFGA